MQEVLQETVRGPQSLKNVEQDTLRIGAIDARLDIWIRLYDKDVGLYECVTYIVKQIRMNRFKNIKQLTNIIKYIYIRTYLNLSLKILFLRYLHHILKY